MRTGSEPNHIKTETLQSELEELTGRVDRHELYLFALIMLATELTVCISFFFLLFCLCNRVWG